MYIQICLLKQPNAVPGDAISSKNVARQIADFPFGIILNIVFISDYMSVRLSVKWAIRFLCFTVFLLHLEMLVIKHKIFS